MTDIFAVAAGLSITASIMAGIIFVLRAALKQRHGISRAAFVFLWLLVFLRACLPFGFDDDFGWAEDPLPGQAIYGAVHGQAFDGQGAAPAPAAGAGERDFRTDGVSEPETGGSPASAPENPAFTSGDIVKLLSLIWAGGTAFFIILFAAAYIKKILHIRKLPSFTSDSEIRAVFERLSAETGTGRAELKKDVKHGGAVYGVFRPVIVLGEENPDRTEMILLHEMIHIKRKDNLKKVFAYGVLALHWFNPVMWLSVRLMCRDIEMACDEKVVRMIGTEGRKHYAGIILSCAQVSAGNAAASYFGESPVYERIKHILSGRKKQRAVPVICGAAAVFLLLGCFTSPVSGVTEKIAESARGDIQSSFQEFRVPEADLYSVRDYAVFSEGAVFVLDKEREGLYTFCVMNEAGEAAAEYDVPKSEGIYRGSMYCDDGDVYFAADSGETITVRKLDTDTGKISDVTSAGESRTSVNLFGGDGYLCWYEGSVLKIFDLTAGKTAAEFETTGNQDYGAVLDGWTAYQYKNPENGAVTVRTVNLISGEYYEAPSALGDNTYSVYGNGKYTVYKEEYGSSGYAEKDGAGYPEVYVYNAAQDTTVSLWELVPEEFADKLSPKLWGINLLGNSLIICGDGNAVYTVDLDNGDTEELISGSEGIGYYTYKNSGIAVSTMLYAAENGGAVGTGNIYIARLVNREN